MPTSLITRVDDGSFVETVKAAPLTNLELDGNFITLAENKLERENNLSDLLDNAAARVNLSVPDIQGNNAFGTWTIAVTGNAGSATALQNARDINGVAFNGTQDITITAATNEPLLFGTGLSASSNFDGSSQITASIDDDVVVTISNDQTITGSKTFNSVVTLGTQATATDHAVAGARTLTAGTGLTGGGDLTDDRTFDIDDSFVITTSNDQNITIDGDKTFAKALSLDVAGTQTTHAVRADRSVNTGDGLEGGGNLTSNRTLAVDNTVIRTSGNQTLGGDKTFSNAVILTTAGTASNHAVRADRDIDAGDGLTGGGDLTADRSFAVDNTVIRTSGDQTLGGNKSFTNSVVLNTPGILTTHAVRADRDLSAGDGLTGGGDLTSDRSFAVDNTVVRTSRQLSAGDGLTGGGTLAANRTFAVDNTVVRTSGNFTLTGQIKLSTQATEDLDAVRGDRTLTAGDGLNGGGKLTANRTFSVDNTVVRTSRNLTAGDGLSGGGNLSSNRTFAVDNTVARTSRDLTAGDGLTGGGDLSSNRTFAVDSTVVRNTRQIIAGDGLDGGGTLGSNVTLNVDDTVAQGGVVVSLREIYTLRVGIESDQGVAESDQELDSDYEDLIVGETILGLTSGATGIIQDIDVDSDVDVITITALIVEGVFSSDDTIQGQESLAEVELRSAFASQTFETQDVRVDGEVIDYIPSDENNVENVTDIPNALDKVLAIGGKVFDWTDEHIARKGGEDDYFIQKSDFGVVAQDVQEVFPQGVREKENGELAVDYRKLFALSFAAIKELNDKIP